MSIHPFDILAQESIIIKYTLSCLTIPDGLYYELFKCDTIMECVDHANNYFPGYTVRIIENSTNTVVHTFVASSVKWIAESIPITDNRASERPIYK